MSVNRKRRKIGEKNYATEKLKCKGGCGRVTPITGYLRYDLNGRFIEEYYNWYCDECATKNQ